MKFFNVSAFTLLLSFVVFTAFGQAQHQQLTSLGSGDVGSSVPQTFFSFQNQLFFVATSKHTGNELWKTDGTEGGTVMVKDINLGPASSSPSNFMLYKNKLYFTANDQIKGLQLWTTDGTSVGTMRVSNNISYSIGQGITLAVADGNFIYVLKKNADYLELWKSDGSSSGTVLVKGDINIWNQPANLTAVGGLVYFTFQPFGTNNTRVWRSDGTANGTFPVSQVLDGNGSGPGGSAHPTQFMEYNGSLYFVARGGAFSSPQSGIMKSDGTLAGTVGVKAIHNGNTFVNYGQRFTHNNKMYFTFFEAPTYRFFIVESDGTTANTSIIFDRTDPHYFSPSEVVARDDFFYFTIGDGADGTALVKLNLATRLHEVLKSVAAPIDKPFIFHPDRNVNTSATTAGKIFYQAQFNNSSTSTLWTTEGTTTTTVKLLDNQATCPMTQFNDKIYFRRTSELGSELWTSDGTVSGTHMVKDINTAVTGVTSRELTTNGTLAVFVARDAAVGNEPRVTDGTVGGTRLLKDMTTGPASSNAYDLIEINGMFVFAAMDINEKTQYYRSDGTEAGTSPITSFTEAKSGTNNIRHTDGKRFFFYVGHRDGTTSLFISDGTAAGTQELKNFGKNMYDVGFYISKTAMGTDRLYFSLSAEGEDLWMSDGTVSGTVKVADVVAMSELTVVDNKAYFIAQPNANLLDFEVFVSDGTVAGTKMIKDLNGSKSSGAFGLTPFSGKVGFASIDDATGLELWITDGTEAGTTLVKDIFPGSEGSISSSELIAFQDRLYFVADDGVHGAELWRSSGTPETTTLFKDIVPGAGNALPGNFKALNDKLYFQAFTPENGYEVWRTDGSADNTQLLIDVIPGPEYSNPFGFIEVDDKLVFFADTQSNGLQLWSYSNSTVTAVEDLESVFSIYPNPSTGIFRIQLNDRITKDAQVEVFSVDGRSIPHAMLDDDGRLDLGNSPAGMYVIKINAGNQKIVRRVVKF